MKSILFVNGCIRGEESRTLLMARRFLDCLRGKYEITEVNGLCLPLDREALKKRDRLAAQGNWDDPVFDEARTFLEADIVVLAAPFWEGTFPAAVHAYIEQICVTGLRLDTGRTEPQKVTERQREPYSFPQEEEFILRVRIRRTTTPENSLILSFGCLESRGQMW